MTGSSSLGKFKTIMEDHIADKRINKMLSLMCTAHFIWVWLLLPPVDCSVSVQTPNLT